MVHKEFIKCTHCGKPSNFQEGPIWMVILHDILCRFCGAVIMAASPQPELNQDGWYDYPGRNPNPPTARWNNRDFNMIARKEDSGKLECSRI